MNPSFLSALAGGLRGGMQGYNTAKAGQRQQALDDLQRYKIEQDDALKAAALAAKQAADQAHAASQAEVLKLKQEGLANAEANQIRDNWGKGWDPKAEAVPQERAQYLGLGEDFLKARPGPDLPKDQYGVYDVPGVDEWNNVPQEAQTRGYVKAKGDDILAEVARKQAALRAEKQKNAESLADRKATASAHAHPKQTPMKDLGDPLLKELSDEQATIDRGRANVGFVVKTVPPGLWTRKTQDALKFLEQQDPATAATFASIDTYYLNERRKQTGAAASVDEDRFIRSTVPNTNDDVRTFLAKSWMTQKMNEYQQARKLSFLAKARNMRGIPIPSVPPEPWKVYRSVDDAIKEMQMQGAAGQLVPKTPSSFVPEP